MLIMTFKCSKCKIEKDCSDFKLRPKTKRGHYTICRKCSNKRQMERRANNGNKNTKKYERTLKGKLVRTYRNMESRVKGILKNKAHLYEGLPIIDRESFYEWSLNNKDYNNIFNKWVENGYNLVDSPSIDRIDPEKGYTIDNIRWVTFSSNCSSARHDLSNLNNLTPN